MLQINKASEITKKKGTYLVYGAPGMGKTSTIKYFPGKTLVLDVDRTSHVLAGCNNIDIIYIDNVKTWSAWETTVTELCKNYVGAYDNVVVDNISELERCLLSDLGSKGKNRGVPCQGDYQYMQFRVVNSLRYLKNLDSNIIWTAWESTDEFISSDGQKYNRCYPQLNGKILNNVLGLCDVVAKMVVKDDGTRGFILSATNSYFAKNQLDDRAGCKQEELLYDSAERLPEKAD